MFSLDCELLFVELTRPVAEGSFDDFHVRGKVNELRPYKYLEYSSTGKMTNGYDFRRCRHVRVAYKLVRAKMLRKSGFLNESGLEQLVRDAPLADRIYLKN